MSDDEELEEYDEFAAVRPPVLPTNPQAEDPAVDRAADKIWACAEKGDWRGATVMFDLYLQDKYRRFIALRHWALSSGDIDGFKTAEPADLAAALPDHPDVEVTANAVAIMCGLASGAGEMAAELFDALSTSEERAATRVALSLLVARAANA